MLIHGDTTGHSVGGKLSQPIPAGGRAKETRTASGATDNLQGITKSTKCRLNLHCLTEILFQVLAILMSKNKK